MKTAMQELIEWVNVNDLKLKISLYNNELIDKLKELLEKEKEQIIDACNSAFEDKTTWGERYYNQTFK